MKRKGDKTMEKIKTKGFTAKDEFNATGAIPIKMVKNTVIRVTDIMVKDKLPDEDGKVDTVGYLKAEDGTLYVTISGTIIEQMLALMEMLDEPQDVLIATKTSNGGREFFILELQ